MNKGFKYGKTKFHGFIFYDENGKPTKISTPCDEVKKQIENYYDTRISQRDKNKEV